MADCDRIFKNILAEFLVLADEKISSIQEMNNLVTLYKSMKILDLEEKCKKFIQCNHSYSCFLLGVAVSNFIKDACGDELNGIPLNDIYELFEINDEFKISS